MANSLSVNLSCSRFKSLQQLSHCGSTGEMKQWPWLGETHDLRWNRSCDLWIRVQSVILSAIKMKPLRKISNI